MTVTKVDWRKLKKWSEVQDELLHKLKEEDTDTHYNIPFGPQQDHTFRHSNPLLCMTNYHTTNGEVFVTHHGKGCANQINVWSLDDSSHKVEMLKIKNEGRVNMQELLFIPRYSIFVAFCPDMTLRVFFGLIQNFQEMYKTQISRTILCMVYNRETDEIIIGGQGFVQGWKFELHEGIPELVQNSKDVIVLDVNEWVIELRIDQKHKQLLILCDNGLYALDYLTREKKQYLKNSHDTGITCCTFFLKGDYFITASKEGSIKVWNMTFFNQVHEFRGHYQPVTSMQVHAAQMMLLSGSLDGTIRLWSLETFELFFRLDVFEPVHRLTLVNSEEIFYSTLHDIKVLKLNLFCSLFSIVQSHVQKLSRVSCRNYPSRILASALDGGIRMLSSVTGALITIIYPMNSMEVWTNYVYNSSSNKLFVVLKRGKVIVFDCSTNPCIAEQILGPHTRDEEIRSIALINLDKQFDSKHVSETLVFAGLKDGTIALLNAETSNMAISVQGHTGEVTLLEASIVDGGDHDIGRCGRLASAGTDNRVKIWSVMLTSEVSGSVAISLLKSISCDGTPKIVAMVGSMVFAAMSEKSVLAAFSIDTEDAKVPAIVHNADDDHIDGITDMDACPALKILATTGDDGVVKIWNFNNELIQEMSFNSTLKGVCFANERGDLLVGLQNHVFSISITNYLSWSMCASIAIQNFDDDIIEQPIGFVNTNKINLDVNLVPIYPANLQKRRKIMSEGFKDRCRQIPIEYKPLPLENESQEKVSVEHLQLEVTPAPKTLAPQIPKSKTTSKITSAIVKVNVEYVAKTEKILATQIPKSKTTSKITSANVKVEKVAKTEHAEEQMKEDDIEVKAEGELEGKDQAEQLDEATERGKEEENEKEQEKEQKKEDGEKEKKPRFPVAPDGYIPNSVIRMLYNIKPPEIIYKQGTFKINPEHLHYKSTPQGSYKKASRTGGYGPEEQPERPLSATSSFKSFRAFSKEADRGVGKGKKKGTTLDGSEYVDRQDGTSGLSTGKAKSKSKSKRGGLLLDKSSDFLKGAKRGNFGSLEAAENQKTAHQRRSKSNAIDNRSPDGLTTETTTTTSMSGAVTGTHNYSALKDGLTTETTTTTSMSGAVTTTHDYSALKHRQGMDSHGQLAESYREKRLPKTLNQKLRKDALACLAPKKDQKSLGLRNDSLSRQNSQEFLVSKRHNSTESFERKGSSLDGSTTTTIMSGAGSTGTHDNSALKHTQRKDSHDRLAEYYRLKRPPKTLDEMNQKLRKDTLACLAQKKDQKSLGLRNDSLSRHDSQEFLGSKRHNSAESFERKGRSLDGSTTATTTTTIMSGAGSTGTHDYSALKHTQRMDSHGRLVESYREKRLPKTLDEMNQKLRIKDVLAWLAQQYGQKSLELRNDSLSKQKFQEFLGSKRHNSAESFERKGEDRDSDSASYGLGSQLLDNGPQKTDQTGGGLKSDDSDIGEFWDPDSQMTSAPRRP